MCEINDFYGDYQIQAINKLKLAKFLLRGGVNCKYMDLKKFELDSPEALEEAVVELGFLPFFRNNIKGFSIEEIIRPKHWYYDIVDGPWEWKGPVIRRQRAAYGKLFAGKAGYVSLDWLPELANYRRARYPLDRTVTDENFEISEASILDIISMSESILSKELKQSIGMLRTGRRTARDLVDISGVRDMPVGKLRGGLETILRRLQMETRVVIADFEYQISKRGERYGWGLARYTTPESFYGLDIEESVDGRSPEESLDRILAHLNSILPDASRAQLLKLIG